MPCSQSEERKKCREVVERRKSNLLAQLSLSALRLKLFQLTQIFWSSKTWLIRCSIYNRRSHELASWFRSRLSCDPSLVIVPILFGLNANSEQVNNSQHFSIADIGIIGLNLVGGSTLVLHNVCYIPKLILLLILVGQLGEAGIRVDFSSMLLIRLSM